MMDIFKIENPRSLDFMMAKWGSSHPPSSSPLRALTHSPILLSYAPLVIAVLVSSPRSMIPRAVRSACAVVDDADLR